MAPVPVSQEEKLKIPAMLRNVKTNMSTKNLPNTWNPSKKPCGLESISAVQASGQFPKCALLFLTVNFDLPK